MEETARFILPRLVKTSGFEEIPVCKNIAIFVFLVVTNIYHSFILPYLLHFNGTLVWTIIPCVILTPLLGGLIHEGIHRMLYPNPPTNDLLSRALSVFLGIAFDRIKLGHLLHHRFNRTQNNCEEVYVIKEKSKGKAIIKHYYKGFFGLYLSDFLFTHLLCFLPISIIAKIKSKYDGQKIVANRSISILIRTGKLKYVRYEGFLALLLLLGTIYCYGTFVWVYAIFLIFKAIILSSLDSLAHYGTPLNDILFAKNIRMPKLLSKVIFLNFNYHGVHHFFPTIPWDKLPEKIDKASLGRSRGFHSGFLEAFLCKLRVPIGIKKFPKIIRTLEDIKNSTME